MSLLHYYYVITTLLLCNYIIITLNILDPLHYQRDLQSEKYGTSNGEGRAPVAFLLSFFPPGSHLGPEELVQSVLLPAFAEKPSSGANYSF